MGDGTGISWTDATWNPVRGCSRVSEGCRNCYAERVAARFSGPGQPYQGLATMRRPTDRNADFAVPDKEPTARPRWTGEVRVIHEHLADPLRWRKPRRIFVNSMSDMFHEKLTNEQILAVFGVMASAPQHSFQVLTKRPARMRAWFAWARHLTLDDLEAEAKLQCGEDRDYVRRGTTWPLPNVWLGVSVENQDAANERIPELLQTPAAIRFLSCEPLLGPVDLHRIPAGDTLQVRGHFSALQSQRDSNFYESVALIDWVIVGCESGPGARACDVDWLRALRDQCVAADVPILLKQAERTFATDQSVRAGDGSKLKGGDVVELPYLDGVQHAAFPEVP